MNEILRIAGYASLFGQADMAGDIVRPGAFAARLMRRGAGGVRMLYQHEASEPIGVWTSMREDDRGLYVEGHIQPSGPRGQTALTLLRSGAVDGLSIGYRPERVRPIASGRELLEVDLWEVSIVTFPMLSDARLRLLPDPAPDPLPIPSPETQAVL